MNDVGVVCNFFFPPQNRILSVYPGDERNLGGGEDQKAGERQDVAGKGEEGSACGGKETQRC